MLTSGISVSGGGLVTSMGMFDPRDSEAYGFSFFSFFFYEINLPDDGDGSFGLIGVEGALEMRLSAYTPPLTRCAGVARLVGISSTR